MSAADFLNLLDRRLKYHLRWLTAYCCPVILNVYSVNEDVSHVEIKALKSLKNIENILNERVVRVRYLSNICDAVDM